MRRLLQLGSRVPPKAEPFPKGLLQQPTPPTRFPTLYS